MRNDRQWCGDDQREGGLGLNGDGKIGGSGDICNSVSHKYKVKK